VTAKPELIAQLGLFNTSIMITFLPSSALVGKLIST
jgi:hypothetical protein